MIALLHVFVGTHHLPIGTISFSTMLIQPCAVRNTERFHDRHELKVKRSKMSFSLSSIHMHYYSLLTVDVIDKYEAVHKRSLLMRRSPTNARFSSTQLLAQPNGNAWLISNTHSTARMTTHIIQTLGETWPTSASSLQQVDCGENSATVRPSASIIHDFFYLHSGTVREQDGV